MQLHQQKLIQDAMHFSISVTFSNHQVAFALYGLQNFVSLDSVSGITFFIEYLKIC